MPSICPPRFHGGSVERFSIWKLSSIAVYPVGSCEKYITRAVFLLKLASLRNPKSSLPLTSQVHRGIGRVSFHLPLPNTAVSNMPRLSSILLFCRISTALVAGSPSPAPTSLDFAAPSGYSTKTYNVSAATTTVKYHYSDEELALLWNQVGSISVGPITSTVSPTPEPSSYPRQGRFHPQVCINTPLLYSICIILTVTGANL
jgi:hypothetical protein